MLPVREPGSGRRDPFAGSDRRRMPDCRHEVSHALRLDLEHAEAGLDVVENGALDCASERLDRRTTVERLLRRVLVGGACSIT